MFMSMVSGYDHKPYNILNRGYYVVQCMVDSRKWSERGDDVVKSFVNWQYCGTKFAHVRFSLTTGCWVAQTELLES